MTVESDYVIGRCKDCGAKIQPLGPSSRCGSCDEHFHTYVDSGWGLNLLIEERNKNQVLGLCFYCGNGLEGPDERLCFTCQTEEQSRSFYRTSKRSSDRNPYTNIWDSNEVDNAVYLDATYGSIAEQMLAKAKYYKRRAERGGPRGRDYLSEARCYVRIAAKLLEREKEVRRKGR